MVNERDYVIKAFEEHFGKDKNIVIYGLGKNTQLLLQTFPEHHFVGLMDEIDTGQQVYGKKVLSFQEVLDEKADLILILARQSNVNIIYHRIEDFCLEHKLPVFDINGDEISKYQSHGAETDFSSWIMREQMKKEIMAHDVISFDVFDTLVMRKTLYPQDIFYIVEAKAQYCWQRKYDFARGRILAERKLSTDAVPNIYEIYDELREILQISKTESDKLLELELDTEKVNLVVRKELLELYHWAVREGKKVYLVSDMYLPKMILAQILEEVGITGYEKLLISCEWRKTKAGGLFRELKKYEEGASILHIGDNPEADTMAAEREGFDALRIYSALEMLEITEYKNLIFWCKTPEERLMLGIFASKAFQDPFLFSKSKGKFSALSCEEFGYMLVGPIITVFLYWMAASLKNRGKGLMLFSARDGYLIERLYKMIQTDEKNSDLPESAYFLASRMASTMAGISSAKDIEYAVTLAFSGNPKDLLEQRFFLPKTEQQTYDGRESPTDYVLRHHAAILKKAAECRMGYQTYIEQFHLDAYSHVYFFDFVSSGTCQRFLEKLVSKRLEGYYFRRFMDEDEEKKRLDIKSLFDEVCVYEKSGYIDQGYVFLEQIVTAPTPSLRCFDKDGEPVYLPENRTSEQILKAELTQKGIEEYFNDFYTNYQDIQRVKLSSSLADEILSLMRPQFGDVGESIYSDDTMVDEFCNRRFSFHECII